MLTLRDKVKGLFPKHKKNVVIVFLQLLQCVIDNKSVNIYRLKANADKYDRKGKKIKQSSYYTRFIRFFKMVWVREFCEGISQMVLICMGETNITHITLDRSNWKRGKQNINILTLGFNYGHCFIPLIWEQLDKRGNSNFSERKALIERFIKLMQITGRSTKNIVLTADREFIGTEWLDYLSSIKMNFVVRLKKNMFAQIQEFGQLNKKRKLNYFNRYIERFGTYCIPFVVAGVQYAVVMTKNRKKVVMSHTFICSLH